MPTFAEKLKELRERAGLTQAALAQSSGLSLGVIRDYEQGKKEPALRSAFKLAEALGVLVDEFRPDAEAPSPSRRPAPVTEPEPEGRTRPAEEPKGKAKGKKRK
jgi:transcriptional regulator with XRE-family HTH domain